MQTETKLRSVLQICKLPPYAYFRGENAAFACKEVFLEANLDVASSIETVVF